MALTALETAIFTWADREFKAIAGAAAKTIFASQSAPRPKFPYLSIFAPNPGVRVGGIDEIRANSGDDTFEQHGQRTTTISLNIYGAKANHYMSLLRDTLDWPPVIEEFERAGIAHLGETGPQDLTAFEDTQNVARSQLDLSISYAFLRTPTTESPVHAIESVEVTQEETPNGDEDFTISRPDFDPDP